MNRAAEPATSLAKPIFVDALYKMTFDDARGILGGDTTATDYFRRQSSGELKEAFKPIVHRTMEQVGVIKQYNQLTQHSVAGPLLNAQGVEVDEYVLGKTLDGLFFVLAQEERKIRKIQRRVQPRCYAKFSARISDCLPPRLAYPFSHFSAGVTTMFL